MLAEELEKLSANAANASELLKAMSNANRLMILCALLNEELSVGELNSCIPLSQSALSQHLAALRNAGLVSTRRDSQTIYYQVNGEAPAKIIAILKEHFCP